MDDITTLSVSAAYGAALVLFVIAAAMQRSFAAGRMAGEPPPMPVGKVPVWFYRNMDLAGLAGIGGLFYLLALANAGAAAEGGQSRVTAEGVLVTIGFQLFTAGIVIAVVIHRVGPVRWLGLAWRKWPLVFAIAPVTVVSMWTIFLGIQFAGYMDLMDKLGVDKVQETVKILREEKDVVVVALMAIAAAVVAPVCEEVIFRGYLYPAAKRFAGPWMAALCSALIFSAAHGSLASLLPLFVFGLVMVALYEWTGSIWAPMAVHALFNAATVAAARYAELPTQ